VIMKASSPVRRLLEAHLDESDDVREELGDASDGVGREHVQRRHVSEELSLEAPRHGSGPFNARPPIRSSACDDLVIDVGHAHHLGRADAQLQTV
jgi:hypothetical protein